MVDFIPFGPLGGQKQDEGGKKKPFAKVDCENVSASWES